MRAARAFLHERDLAALLPAPLRAIRIRLEKRIPVAAGLGGGSSDAAAVLRALLALAVPEAAHDPEALAAVALSVGADVPFFLDPAPAWVSGIGEVIAPIGDLPPLWLLLANPGISVATADVYGLWDHRFGRPAEPAPASGGSLTPEGAASTMPALSGLGGDPKALIRLLTALNGGAPGAGSRAPTIPNDLEAGAIRLCPPVARLRDRIGALEDALALGMSGSGATVYGVFASGSSAERAMAAACFESPVWARVVRSLGVAPRVEVERGAGQDPGASPNW